MAKESQLSWLTRKLCHRCHHLIGECKIASEGIVCKEVTELAREIHFSEGERGGEK